MVRYLLGTLIAAVAISTAWPAPLFGDVAPKIRDLDLDPTAAAQIIRDHFLVIISKPRPIEVTIDGDRTRDDNARFVSGLAVINKPVTEVRNAVADFHSYTKFMPQVAQSQVEERFADGATVSISIRFDIPVVKLGVDYTTRYVFKPDGDISFKNIKGDLVGSFGNWEFIPVGPEQTLLVYTSWTNFDAMGFLARTALKLQPDLKVALPSSTGAVIVRAVKEHLEGKPPIAQKSKLPTSPKMPLISKGELPVDALRAMAKAGTLVFVYPEQKIHQLNQDVTLSFVSGGALVDVPYEVAKSGGTDFERYPEFFDQVKSATPIKEGGRNLVDWKLKIDFGFLSIPLRYQLQYAEAGPHAWPFRRIGGDMEFIYGALEWIPVSDSETLIIYTTASTPGKNGAAILKIADMVPNNQMITGVSVATVVVERQAPWLEQHFHR